MTTPTPASPPAGGVSIGASSLGPASTSGGAPAGRGASGASDRDPAAPRFSTLLVANRGEIALRIVRAARAEGLRTVAVYAENDASAPHVRLADAAEPIGSYLAIDDLLDAARRSGAGAVHPGYGFLSENAGFAAAVAEAGLVWVGPSAEVIEVMGRKDRARDLAERAGVAVTDRWELDGDTVVGDVRFPVLVKAAAGGGGKGMRVVRAAGDLPDAIAAAGREAVAAFGDPTLLVEQYVERGRHVEVQVIGDEHGTVVHLGERDCSAQRRHQKVLEEAPAPTIADRTRRRLTDAAVALCHEVGYVNAGTVEFLVFDSPSGEEQIAFLEMNTRLQVEHPVTEAVTGLDLVALQLRVAQGRTLGLAQSDVVTSGHAIEARVYAEDPYAGFLPQAGRATSVVWPERVRVDAALESGSVVTTAYDPMLGKVIAYGADREAARLALRDALGATAVLGITTNVGFLRRLVDSPEFAGGAVHTAWLDSEQAEPLLRRPDVPGAAVEAAGRAWADRYAAPGDDPFGTADGWRSSGPAAGLRVELVGPDGEHHEVTVGPAGPQRVVSEVRSDGVDVVVDGQTWHFRHPDPARDPGAEQAGDADVVAPMPGTVLAVDVGVGDPVAAGQVLAVVEAMKMELALKAPYDGVVTDVRAVAGASVALGDLLVTVEPAEGAQEA
ncbi:3-methylcrotonyl-CoA carboxylase alpha subunit [Mumia flava]|uniref:3-methylcrotonyl-CoA carboxylase alpha subunit n=1 Tax=Mumia flava TaxID=1348852 RepID=A0A2M9BI12_9ACTN|nr:biotin carboxylase N-terminal domain-containing protein [Mumia flava]PJJ57570.1 3-methylcrotonyl-CoA carboxylase alpha subunit [Mumia flava]